MNALSVIEDKLPELDMNDFENETPRSRHRHLEIQQITTEDTTQNLMHSCCGGMSDKRLVILLTQVSVSILVLGFSGAMLAVSDEPNDKAIYMSLISSTLSYRLGKNDGEKK